ncbi:spore germination protein [Cohnella suwonensis]|uniref:Spore germination protein n=1 Tax=Cohnella suwonensis TaxID=696072 RepID=A0ABW0LSK5_9BACL
MSMDNLFREALYVGGEGQEGGEDRDGEPSVTLEQLDDEGVFRLFEHSRDVNVYHYRNGESSRELNPLLVYCDGMIDGALLNDFLYTKLHRLLAEPSDDRPSADGAPSFVSQNIYRIREPNAVEQFIRQVMSGNLVLFFARSREAFAIQMCNPPQRTPSESNTEISVKGPRDGFTESIETNIALIRKRLKTPKLAIRYYQIGRRSATSVALVYMTDIANDDLVREASERIQRIEIDGLLSSQQLEEALSDASSSFFPLIEYMGRPDYISESLLLGRFAIVVDGSPMVLVAPTNLTSLIKSPEDMHLPYYYVFMEKILRLLGLAVALFLPGFWVSISAFNLDQIPFPLLATVVISRLGLPLSGPIDLFLMLGLFELFREAGMRLPKAVGQTVAVVGGLIVGEAAISAGFTGPTTLVVSAVTAVSTFTLVNQSLSGAVTVIRFVVLTFSCVFGMLGFFMSLFGIVVYLSSLTSFGVPFLSPLSPIRFRESLFALFRFPRKMAKKRPGIYEPKDSDRQGEKS